MKLKWQSQETDVVDAIATGERATYVVWLGHAKWCLTVLNGGAIRNGFDSQADAMAAAQAHEDGPAAKAATA